MATNVSTRDGIIDASTMAKNLFDVSGSNVHFGCGKTRREKIKATYGIPSVSIGDWPWMVPLFKKTDLGLQFLCSSTLISRDLVVTGDSLFYPKYLILTHILIILKHFSNSSNLPHFYLRCYYEILCNFHYFFMHYLDLNKFYLQPHIVSNSRISHL